jgi:WD40 repeat protein
MRGLLQVITGSHDKTVRLWDIRSIKAKTMATLTYHKKSVRHSTAKVMSSMGHPVLLASLGAARL